MAQFDGYSQLVCDRCKKTAFSRTSEVQTLNWKFINRTSVNGAAQPYTLCPDCYPKARDILMRHDSEFSNFMLKPDVDPVSPTTDAEGTKE